MGTQPSSSDESLSNYATKRLSAKHLRALEHILSGKSESRQLAKYIDPQSTPNQSASDWVERLVPSSQTKIASAQSSEYQEQLERFLNLLDTEFSRSELSANQAVNYLVDNYGDAHPTLTTELLEDVTRPDLLIATYYCMYDRPAGALSDDFRNLLAAAKIYKQNTKTTFTVDNEQVPFPRLEANIRKFLGSWNTNGQRKLAVERTIDVPEETGRLKLYREKRRSARHVFKFRQQGRSIPPKPKDPTIEYESAFAVDTLGVDVRNLQNKVKIEFSGDLSGWTRPIEKLVEKVFEIGGGRDALTRKSYPGANHVLTAARSGAKQVKESEETKLIAEVNEAATVLTESVLEELRDDSTVDSEEVEEAEAWYESLALAGYRVLRDEQTNVHKADVQSQGVLEDIEEQVSRLGLVEYFQQASDDRLALLFQIENPETGERAVFQVHRGDWSVVGRGIESAAFERIEAMMENEL